LSQVQMLGLEESLARDDQDAGIFVELLKNDHRGTVGKCGCECFATQTIFQVFQERSGNASFSTRGFLAGKMRNRDLLRFPPLNEAEKIWPYVIPVTTTSVGRVSAYVAMSHEVSSSLGTLSIAANQIIA
jgi:hypothetical protein